MQPNAPAGRHMARGPPYDHCRSRPVLRTRTWECQPGRTKFRCHVSVPVRNCAYALSYVKFITRGAEQGLPVMGQGAGAVPAIMGS